MKQSLAGNTVRAHTAVVSSALVGVFAGEGLQVVRAARVVRPVAGFLPTLVGDVCSASQSHLRGGECATSRKCWTRGGEEASSHSVTRQVTARSHQGAALALCKLALHAAP